MTRRLKQNPEFVRLRQGGRGSFGRTSYWLGKDHLLVVEIGQYFERYRRFAFRDVQAVVVLRTRARTWWSFGLALVTAPMLVGLASVWLTGDLPTLLIAGTGMGILGILGVTGLIFNGLRGPTCAVHLRTAVQTQRLRGVTRWRKAEELIATLTPPIQAAQQGMSSPAQPAPATPGPAVADGDVPPGAGEASA